MLRISWVPLGLKVKALLMPKGCSMYGVNGERNPVHLYGLSCTNSWTGKYRERSLAPWRYHQRVGGDFRTQGLRYLEETWWIEWGFVGRRQSRTHL